MTVFRPDFRSPEEVDEESLIELRAAELRHKREARERSERIEREARRRAKVAPPDDGMQTKGDDTWIFCVFAAVIIILIFGFCALQIRNRLQENQARAKALQSRMHAVQENREEAMLRYCEETQKFYKTLDNPCNR